MENYNLNFQIQNLTAQLENIRFQISNLNINPNKELIRSGIEIINSGIQVLNIFIQLENAAMDMKLNYNLQIQNIGFQLQNIGLILQQYVNKPSLRETQNINFNAFQPFNQEMNIINNDNDNKIKNVPKKTIMFESRDGKRINIVLPYDTTVENAINKYYESNPEIKKERRNIFFIYNARKINVNDMSRTIKEFFEGNLIRVIVYDNKLIGG